jgi:hypothetical protein
MRTLEHCLPRTLLGLAALVGGLALGPPSLAAAPPKGPTNDDCLACHDDDSLKRSDGRPIALGRERLAASVHGQAGLACTDCHAALAKTTDFPHAEKLAPVDCASCHEEPGRQYASSIHAQARRKAADSPAATCKDCHGAHEILPVKDPKSLIYHLNLPQTCGKCHGSSAMIQQAHIRIGNVPALFEESIHGRALRQKGLLVAPNCGNCHGNHHIRLASDPESRVNRERISATCGSCHEGIRTVYEASVHWAQHKAGNPRAAVCSDCHSAHGIQSSNLPAWRLEVLKECGSCHAQSLRSYRDGFHGQVSELGFTRVATCADCHGSHQIAAKASADSLVHPARRPQTCGKCHPGASARFTQYDPHAEPENRERSAILYFTTAFMKMLLAGVFLFFGVHTALWFPRSLKERRQSSAGGHAQGGEADHV